MEKLSKSTHSPISSKMEPAIENHVKIVYLPQPRSFPCPHPGCNYAATDKYRLKRHTKIHSSIKAFVCSHSNCNYSETERGNFTAHARRHTGEKSWVCQFESCSYATVTSSKLVSHTRTHTKERPYKCAETNCDFSTALMSNLKRHQLVHLPKEDDARSSFKCSLCEYKGKSKTLLSSHVNYKHVLLKSIACPVESCEYRCSVKSSLDVHTKTHSEEKQYKCELCPFRAKTRCTVRNHLKNIHSDFRPFTCPEQKCDSAFKTRGDLQRHLLTHTEEKKYSCSFSGCNFKTATKRHAKRHEYNIHSEEKKEKCWICTYRCKTKAHLTIHMRTHTKEEPYKCKEPNCEYRAKQGNNLKQHQKKHHPQLFSEAT